MGITGASQNSFTLDADTLLADSLALSAAATTIGQVGGADGQLDFGGTSPNGVEQVAYVRGQFVLDVTVAPDLGTGDESYDWVLQLADDDSDFTAATTVVSKPLVHLGTALGTNGDTMSGAGRSVVGVDNEFQGTLFRYARLVIIIAGTTPSVTSSAAFVRSY